MPRMIGSGLSRREREIVDLLHRLGPSTASEVHEAMTEAPSYSAARSILRILEEKGHVKHIEQGKRYVYVPVEPRQAAARSALDQVVQTFFGGSLEGAVRTFLSSGEANVSEEELNRLSALIEGAKAQEKVKGEKP